MLHAAATATPAPAAISLTTATRTAYHTTPTTPEQVSERQDRAYQENRPELVRIQRADRTLFVAVEVSKS